MEDFSFSELLEDAPVPADDWEKVVKENKILLHVIDARRPADTIVEDVRTLFTLDAFWTQEDFPLKDLRLHFRTRRP